MNRRYATAERSHFLTPWVETHGSQGTASLRDANPRILNPVQGGGGEIRRGNQGQVRNENRSLKFPSDITLGKSGTDILLLATAHAPEGKPVAAMSVRLRVGEAIDKTVAVFGDRTWIAGGILSSWKISAPAPFEAMPLRWERAYGGADQLDPDDETTSERIEENPLGFGHVHSRAPYRGILGRRLPNLENPRALITSWKKRSSPAGFGAISVRWQPRCGYAGTYETDLGKGALANLPKDFDPRFFQTAPADQIVPGHLQGGENVEVRGVRPGGETLHFAIPAFHLEAQFRLSSTAHNLAAQLETVTIQSDENRLTLVWGVHFSCDKKVTKLREIALNLTGPTGQPARN
jgi:hypothetical protein